METNYVHKDSATLVENELNQIELQYNALKQQKFNELLKENQELKEKLDKYENPNDDMGHWKEEIKSVITHEQMEQMAYKVVE